MTVFFKLHSGQTNRQDATRYTIFAYLTLFRLDELQVEDFKRIVMSQDPVKLHVFLQFIFDADKLRAHVREEWIQLYDYSYIDDKIIAAVERNLPNVAEILGTVEKKATGHIVSTLTQSSFSAAAAARGSTETGESMMKTMMEDEVKRKEPTKPQPFNLTKPKPKVIPPPEAVKREVKANPVPKKIYKKTLADIEQEKADRRKAKVNRIKNEYETSKAQPFALQTATRGTDMEQLKQEVTAKQLENVNFNAHKA